jgi:AraC-like DNA-binding protein
VQARNTIAKRMGGTDPNITEAGAPTQRSIMLPNMVRFSTDDFPERERIEAYREIYGRTIIKHEIKPIGDQPFHFDALLCAVPGLGLAWSNFSPCWRSNGGLHNESDHLILGIGHHGRCVVQQRNREAVILGAEAVLTNSADPAVVAITAPSQSTSIRIPRSAIRSKVGDVDARVSQRISQRAGFQLLSGYLDAVRNSEALADPRMCDLVVAHVHDLVAMILGASGEARRLAEDGGGRAARLAAIFHAIDRRSGDPGLSATAVAALLGVTSRYVHLLLEETGRSFTHHLLERRLENAVALLRDPRRYRHRIGEIALEAGFTDFSYFSRAFRRRYGMTPSDMREEASRRS